MNKSSKFISLVLSLVMLMSAFAVASVSFAAEPAAATAVFRVEGKRVGYNQLVVSVYAPAGSAGGSYTLSYNTDNLILNKPKADASGAQSDSVSFGTGFAVTNYNFGDSALRCTIALVSNQKDETLCGTYKFNLKDEKTDEKDITLTSFSLFEWKDTENASVLIGSDATASCVYQLSPADWTTVSLKNVNDTWYYMENGVNNKTYSGITKYYDLWYYVSNGSVDWSYTGLTQYGNTWYFISGGRLDWDYTGITNYYGVWYYVSNGAVDWGFTGITNYYGTWYFINGGVLDWDYTGITNYYGTWYFINGGVLDWDYTGITNYYGTWYYIGGGVLDWNYTGLTKYYNTWYYINKGALDWNYTGYTTYYGTRYYVKNGVLA